MFALKRSIVYTRLICLILYMSWIHIWNYSLLLLNYLLQYFGNIVFSFSALGPRPSRESWFMSLHLHNANELKNVATLFGFPDCYSEWSVYLQHLRRSQKGHLVSLHLLSSMWPSSHYASESRFVDPRSPFSRYPPPLPPCPLLQCPSFPWIS